MSDPANLAWTSAGPEGRLTVVVPAWRAAAFIEATLGDLLAQTQREFSLIVTVDGDSDDGTAQRVIARLTRARRPWRTEVWIAPTRLGWVDNTNCGLRLVRTRRACVMPHDDRLHPRYLAALEVALEANPGAAVASSDIRFTGQALPGESWRTWLSRKLGVGRGQSMAGTGLIGGQRERVRSYLIGTFSAVAFRGLIDREVVGADWLIDHGSCDDFAADTTWVFKLAMSGALVRVPEELYRKRMRLVGAHAGWFSGDCETLRRRWLAHCRDCRAVLARVAGEAAWPEARRWLLARLLQHPRPLGEKALWPDEDRRGKRAAAKQLFAD